MKEQASSKQYTIRGIPREVDRALRQKAARQKRSLNQVVVEELTEATIGAKRKTDLSDVTGGWIQDPAFDEIVASQRQIDWDKWK
jgi:plasmid stability protein